MDSHKISQLTHLLDPDAGDWKTFKPSKVALIATPLGLQPNGFIQKIWEDKQDEYGQTEFVQVVSVNDGKRIAFRLEWKDETQDNGEGEGFPDGAVLAFPMKGDPMISTMGDEESPIHAVHWSARKNQVRSVVATGIGTSRSGPDIKPLVNSVWRDGHWAIVIVHNIESAGNIELSPGNVTKVGFAVWNGSNLERAGIKAYSPDWTLLKIKN